MNITEVINMSVEHLRAEIAIAERKVEELKNKLVDAIRAEKSAKRRMEQYMYPTSHALDLSSSDSESVSDDTDEQMEERARKVISEMKTIIEEMGKTV